MSAAERLARIIFSGLNDIEEWRLGDPALAAAKGYPRVYDVPAIDGFGIVFVDVTLDARTGAPVCHEVNGPNAVGSDALTGDSALRADVEARHAVHRAEELGHVGAGGRVARPIATVHAHQHWPAFRTGGEFYPRVLRFAERLEGAWPDATVCLRGAGEASGDEHVAVVVGDVPSVAAHLEVDPATGRFHHRGRPVVFLGNPNLVPELLRTGKLAAVDGTLAGADLRTFHAWRLLDVVHDKVLQQALLRGTGIAPLRCFAAWSRDDALRETRRLLATGPVVLKPHGTSGGAGVHVVVPAMRDEEIHARLDLVVSDCVRKYGAGAETTVLPIRGFEFVRSTGYPMGDGDHLWDLRVAVLFEPGIAKVFPVSLRIAPEPFDAAAFHERRDQWVSNVSGRQVTLLRSGMDDETLAAVGMTPATLEHVFAASVCWTAKAWEHGGGRGDVWEDDCERADPGFYPARPVPARAVPA